MIKIIASQYDKTNLWYHPNDVYAGILKRTNQGCTLQLDHQFIEKSKVPYFTYCLKNDATPIVTIGDNLPPFFAGLLPEGLRFNALVRQLKTSQDDCSNPIKP